MCDASRPTFFDLINRKIGRVLQKGVAGGMRQRTGRLDGYKELYITRMR